MNFTVNQKLCIKCRLCIEVCPVNLIETDLKNRINFIMERTSVCLKCGQCMAVCSTKAIKAGRLTYETDFVDFEKSDTLGYYQFMDFLSKRRSVRNFIKKPVPNEVIIKILNSIAYAPYGASPQKMHITVINNRKTIEKALPFMEEFLNNIVKWIENPVVSFIIKKKTGVETFNTIKNHLYPIAKADNYKLKYGDRITRDAPAILIFHALKSAEEHTNNALIYATYTMLAAHALGMGATLIGIVPAAINKVKAVKNIFNIPKQHEAVMSVIVGYPKIHYQRAVKRRLPAVNFG